MAPVSLSLSFSSRAHISPLSIRQTCCALLQSFAELWSTIREWNARLCLDVEWCHLLKCRFTCLLSANPLIPSLAVILWPLWWSMSSLFLLFFPNVNGSFSYNELSVFFLFFHVVFWCRAYKEKFKSTQAIIFCLRVMVSITNLLCVTFDCCVFSVAKKVCMARFRRVWVKKKHPPYEDCNDHNGIWPSRLISKHLCVQEKFCYFFATSNLGCSQC